RLVEPGGNKSFAVRREVQRPDRSVVGPKLPCFLPLGVIEKGHRTLAATYCQVLSVGRQSHYRSGRHPWDRDVSLFLTAVSAPGADRLIGSECKQFLVVGGKHDCVRGHILLKADALSPCLHLPNPWRRSRHRHHLAAGR